MTVEAPSSLTSSRPERTGVAAPRREVLPKKEYLLSSEQTLASEMAIATNVIGLFSRSAQSELPWLRLKDRQVGQRFGDQEKRDGELMAQYVSGMLDAYTAREPEEVKAKRKERASIAQEMEALAGNPPVETTQPARSELSSWGDKADYLKGQLDSLMPEIDETKDRIRSDAQSWTYEDYRRVNKETKHTIRKLPKDQREILEARSGVKPKTINRMLFEYGVPTAGATAHYALPEAITGGLAYLISTKTPILDIIPEQYDIKTATLASVWALLEKKWIDAMRENVVTQTELLDTTNFTNVNIFSKLTYDAAKWMEKGNRGEGSKWNQKAAASLAAVTPERVKDYAQKIGPRKLAVAAGHIGPQAVTELGYTFGTIGFVENHAMTLDQGIFLCLVANAIGYGVEKAETFAQNRVIHPENYTFDAMRERAKTKAKNVMRRTSTAVGVSKTQEGGTQDGK